jgi:hypothetical protein
MAWEHALRGMEIGQRPDFTAVGVTVCREWTVWPEQLVGLDRAGPLARYEGVPLSTGRCYEPSRLSYIVMARRFAWHLAFQHTEAPVPEIAEAFGGHSPSTVQPWVYDLTRFEELYSRPTAHEAIGARMARLSELAVEEFALIEQAAEGQPQ